VALPVAVRAGQNLDRADSVDAHLRALPEADARAQRAHRRRRRDAAGLDVATHADAAQPALLRSFGATLLEAGIVSRLHRGFERRLVVAGIVVHDDRRLVGELADEVLAPQLRRRHSQLARGRLDDTLEQVGRLGP